MSDIIQFPVHAQVDRADSAPKNIVDLILAAGGTRDKAEWIFSQLMERTENIPSISVQIPLGNNAEALTEAIDALSLQLDAMKSGFTISLVVALGHLYDMKWPSDDDDGSRIVA